MSMEENQWEHLTTIFENAQNQAKNLRPQYLTAACAGNMELKTDIEKMLRVADVAAFENFLATPAIIDHELMSHRIEVASAIGDRIGPYEIMSEIGRGGMGAVYLAVRADSDAVSNRNVRFWRRWSIPILHDYWMVEPLPAAGLFWLWNMWMDVLSPIIAMRKN